MNDATIIMKALYEELLELGYNTYYREMSYPWFFLAIEINMGPRKGIGWDLFKRLRDDKNTGISDALERGMSESVKFVNYKLMESINDGSVQSIQFFLRNRRPEEWNHDNKSTVEHTLDLASIIGTRKQALAHASTPAIAPNDALIINNDD